jgi:hypothetical protein
MQNATGHGSKKMFRQTRPNQGRNNDQQELPVGSELLIGLTLGLGGWWAIVHAVIWIAGR